MVASVSITLLIYLTLTEGFTQSKAWVYIISAIVAGVMWVMRRNQRLKK